MFKYHFQGAQGGTERRPLEQEGVLGPEGGRQPVPGKVEVRPVFSCRCCVYNVCFADLMCVAVAA